jgi:undecaprenyl-phosphate 4-deoxy-4-formamido-L-arabinose transferase
MQISIVIPVYRSAGTLPRLTERLLAVLDPTGLDYEIIFVCDGSPDNSWSVLEQLKRSHPGRIVAVELMRNYGQHNALMCGLRHSRGEFVVTMDDDLQNPPEEIPKLIRAIRETGLDLVYGAYAGKRHAAWRNLGSTVVNVFYRFVFKTRCTVTAFRIMRRELVESIFTYNLNFTFLDGLLAWNTQRIGEVEVEHRPRSAGRSGYSLARLLVLALNLFTNFSLVPLQIASALGLAAACGGIVGALYFLVRYLLSGIIVAGYASTIVAILVLGGMQLLSLGIIGEYLGRLHLNVNRKPQYVERRVLAAEGPSAEAAREPAVRPRAVEPAPQTRAAESPPQPRAMSDSPVAAE